MKWSQLVEKNEIKQNKQASKQTHKKQENIMKPPERETQGEGYHSNG